MARPLYTQQPIMAICKCSSWFLTTLRRRTQKLIVDGPLYTRQPKMAISQFANWSFPMLRTKTQKITMVVHQWTWLLETITQQLPNWSGRAWAGPDVSCEESRRCKISVTNQPQKMYIEFEKLMEKYITYCKKLVFVLNIHKPSWRFYTTFVPKKVDFLNGANHTFLNFRAPKGVMYFYFLNCNFLQ